MKVNEHIIFAEEAKPVFRWKQIKLLLLTAALFVLSACQSGNISDIYMLLDNINAISETYSLRYEDILGQETQDGHEYEIFIPISGGKHLMLLCAKADKSRNITGITLTLSSESFSYSSVSEFFTAAQVFSDAYTFSQDDHSAVMSELTYSMSDIGNESFEAYHDTHRYSYSLASNGTGLFFSVQSRLLAEPTSEPLTLR